MAAPCRQTGSELACTQDSRRVTDPQTLLQESFDDIGYEVPCATNFLLMVTSPLCFISAAQAHVLYFRVYTSLHLFAYTPLPLQIVIKYCSLPVSNCLDSSHGHGVLFSVSPCEVYLMLAHACSLPQRQAS
jgi:hypothetical protein